MVEDVKLHGLYESKSGIVLRVVGVSSHGQDCSISMVTYENVTETYDTKVTKPWTIEENLFLARNEKFDEQFTVDKNGQWNTTFPPVGVWVIIREVDENDPDKYHYEKCIRPLPYVMKKHKNDVADIVYYAVSGRTIKARPEWQYA